MRSRSFATAAPAVLLASALVLPQAARGNDYLRGSQYGDAPLSSGSADFSGFYAGATAGNSNINFASNKSPGALISNYLRHTTIENEMNVSGLLNIPSRSTNKGSFGGFVGYNTQMDDFVIGIEGDYTRLGATITGSDQISRIRELSDGYRATASVSGSVRSKIDQIATLRARAGYVIGNFMPFVTAGFAVGTGKIDSSAKVKTTYVDADPTDATPLPTIDNPTASLTGKRSNTTMAGGVVGGGVEAMLGSVLLRAEVLYARLGAPGRTTVDHTTARLGAGVKF